MQDERTVNFYLDNNATTQPLPEVQSAVEETMSDLFANPSSRHAPGRLIRARVEQAREEVCALVGAMVPDEIVFTSGGTESIGHVFFIATNGFAPRASHIAVSSVEHAAVLDAASFYATHGARVHIIGVDEDGRLDLDSMGHTLSEISPGSLVSIMLANNETGVIFPVREVAAICQKHRHRLHVDAVQAAGKLPINVSDLGCDYLSISAHKFHGPKGVGALYIRHGAPRMPMIMGHQENGARGGTENVVGIIGMGTAARSVMDNLSSDVERMQVCRDRIEKAILATIPGSEVNGGKSLRICNTTSIYFPGKDSAELVENLSARGIHVSAGAACTTGGKPSHVLQAMGLGEKRANGSIRFSVGKLCCDIDAGQVAKVVRDVYNASMDVYQVS